MEAAQRSHDRSQYQGKRLLYLLLAFLVPAALLYLRIVLGLAATDSRVEPATARSLSRWSSSSLIAFFVSQLFCAFYVRRLAPVARTRAGRVFQYLGIFIMCLLFSLTAAVSLEAFGFDVFLRAAGR